MLFFVAVVILDVKLTRTRKGTRVGFSGAARSFKAFSRGGPIIDYAFGFAGVNSTPLIVRRTMTSYKYAMPRCARRPVVPKGANAVGIACGKASGCPKRFGGSVALHAGTGARVVHLFIRNSVATGSTGWTGVGGGGRRGLSKFSFFFTCFRTILEGQPFKGLVGCAWAAGGGCRAEEERICKLAQRHVPKARAKEDMRPTSRSGRGMSKNGPLIYDVKCHRNRPFLNYHDLSKAGDEADVQDYRPRHRRDDQDVQHDRARGHAQQGHRCPVREHLLEHRHNEDRLRATYPLCPTDRVSKCINRLCTDIRRFATKQYAKRLIPSSFPRVLYGQRT